MGTKISKSIIVLCTMIMSFHSYSQFYCNSNPVDVHGKLSVSGNRIVDQNNQSVSFAGNSMFWSNEFFGAERFYNANVVSTLKEDWGATIVRAAMGVDEFGGFLTFPNENRDRVKAVVDAAIAEDMYVIIDWHTHHAESNKQTAIDFFREMATLYGDNPHVIYEIYNEPIDSDWSRDIKPYAEDVIEAIRAIDPDNLIIVGTPFFSQNVDVASNDPITTSTNIAYTLHFYAGTHGESLRSRARTALNNGIALMVTEWGTVNANGDGGVNRSSTNEWLDFLGENDISHLNWSVHDKVEGASILQPGAATNGNWQDSELTESGLFVRDIIQNWEQFCGGESVSDPVTPEVENSLTVSGLSSFDSEGASQSITVTSNVDWVVSENADWISVNTTSGSNNGSINVTASANASTSPRSATITISGGDISRSITINQEANTPESLLTASNLSNFSSEGGLQTITITSNIDWRVLEEADWITVGTAEGSNNGSSSVTVSENTSTESRTAVITVSGGIGFKRFVSVTQEGASAPAEFIAITSRIEAEDFINESGTRVENTTDVGGGMNVGFIDTNDYLEYNINVPNSGTYSIDFRIASRSRGTSFDIFTGNSLIGNVSSNATGGWQDWETVTEVVSLNQGNQTLRLVATGTGWNINWLEFSEGRNNAVIEDEEVAEEDNTNSSNTSEDCGSIQTWSADTVYSEADTQVVLNGIIYENKWYTLNQNPEAFSEFPWSLWTVLGSCDDVAAKSINNTIGITTYPNPFVNTINVTADEANQVVDSLQLVDLSGNIVAVENGAVMNNLDRVASGMYLLQIINTNGEIIAVEKVIKE